MDGAHWMTSAMRAARDQLEIAAQNLANTSTGGFRKLVGTVRLDAGGLHVGTAASPSQGGIRQTGRAFDLALLGDGAFVAGGRRTRDGSFTRDREGFLVDDRGGRLQGSRGAIRVSAAALVDRGGVIRDGGRIVDRIPLPPGTSVLAGALEASTVSAIDETLAIVTAQRAFETAQKTLGAIDQTREKAVDDVARLK